MRPALSTSPSPPTTAGAAAAEEVEAPLEFDLEAEAPLEFDLDARVGPDAEPEDGSRERRLLLCAPTSREKSEITVAAPSGFSGFHDRKRKELMLLSVSQIHEN